jgi:membrane-bound lytic murein transglycosylase C
VGSADRLPAKIKVMVYFALLFVFVVVSPAQSSFEEFLREERRGFEEEKRGFERYLKEIEREFEEYKRITREEFERFKGEVLRHLGVYEGSTRKKLVQYSRDYRIKKVFDFEKGELRIEAKGGKKYLSRLLKKELESFILEDKRSAFNKDPVLVGIERRARKRLKNLKTGVLGREPLL